jgi:hypothetical protein
VRAALIVVLLVLAVALAGCRPAADAGRPPDPAEVAHQEDIVTDLERVVGSAEAEAADD